MKSIDEPPENLGRLLKRLAKEEFGSQQALANHIGLSPGRISQIVRGNDPNLSYQTLEQISAAFPNPGQQGRLYHSWIKEYAPHPLDHWQIGDGPVEDQLLSFLHACQELISQGQHRMVLRVTKGIWHKLKHQHEYRELAWQAGEAFVHAACLVEYRRVAVNVAREMADIAIESFDPARAATGLWLAVVAGRPLNPGRMLTSGSPMDHLTKYMGQWQPRSDAERETHLAIQRALARDQALTAWDAFRQGKADQRLVRDRLSALVASGSLITDSIGIALVGEVEARLRIVLGEFDEADRLLSIGSKIDLPENDLLSVKISLSNVRLFIEAGELDEAEDQLLRCRLVTERHSMFHYSAELMRLERDLWH